MDYCFNKNDFHFTVADNGVSTLALPAWEKSLYLLELLKKNTTAM